MISIITNQGYNSQMQPRRDLDDFSHLKV